MSLQASSREKPLSSGPMLVIDDTVLELLPVAVCVCDTDGTIVRYNRKASELWGRSPRPGHPEDRFCGSHRLLWSDGREISLAERPMAEALRTGVAVQDRELIIEQPNGRRIWALANVEPIRNSEGEVTGVINCLQDITPRKAEEADRSEREQHFRDLLEALPAAVYTTDSAGGITFYNQAAAELWGHRPELGTSEWCGSWRLYWPDGSPLPHDQCPMAIALKEERPIRGMEAVAERPDGTRVPFIPYPTPLRDTNGDLTGAVNMLVDITHRKEAEKRQELLIQELHHRVKNTLATVQCIAAITFQADSANSERKWFEGRLMALAAAHNVLSREHWEGAGLHEIVGQAVSPFRAQDESRFDINGPAVWLQPRVALSLAMALHELCTNASKYGALSSEQGRLRMSWDVSRSDKGSRLSLLWQECDGPPVVEPQRRGFGSRLIQHGLAHELDGEVDLDFAPSGVACKITIPLP